MAHERLDVVHPTSESNVLGLRCRECGREYPVAPIYTCEWCFGPLEVAYDYDAIASGHQPREDRGRARAASGATPTCCRSRRDPSVDLGTGFTPLVRADRLAAELGLGEVWIKNDTRNPTNSFKDRVVSIALSKALEFGFKVAACASTGNLANSVAAHAAHAGLRSYVFIPSNLEQGKIVTTSVYGGNVVAIEGNYDDVNRLCAELAGIYDWAFVNVNMRPFYAEGSKTLAFETAEQLGWQHARPRRRARRERFAAHQDPEGLRGAAPGRPARRGAARARVGRAGARLLADRDRVHRGVRHDPAGEARHDRQVARDRQPGRRLLRARRGAQQRRRLRVGHRRRDRRGHGAARPDRGHLRRDRGRRDDRDVAEARGRRRDPRRRARRRLHHRPRTEDDRSGRADAAARPRRSRRRSTRSTPRSTSRSA